MQEITLTQKEFKALSSPNRVKMLKLLLQQNHTLTELSRKTELSSPSAKQHLEVLMRAQLIEQIDEGRKWKYYTLTKKGKNILDSKEEQTHVFILLSVASIAFVGVLMMLLLSTLSGLSGSAGMESVSIIQDEITPASAPVAQGSPAPEGIPLSTEGTQEDSLNKAMENQEKDLERKEITSEIPAEKENMALIGIAVVLGIAVLLLGHRYFKGNKAKT